MSRVFAAPGVSSGFDTTTVSFNTVRCSCSRLNPTDPFVVYCTQPLALYLSFPALLDTAAPASSTQHAPHAAPGAASVSPQRPVMHACVPFHLGGVPWRPIRPATPVDTERRQPVTKCDHSAPRGLPTAPRCCVHGVLRRPIAPVTGRRMRASVPAPNQLSDLLPTRAAAGLRIHAASQLAYSTERTRTSGCRLTATIQVATR